MSTLKTNTLSNVAGTASTAIENAINGSAKAWVNFDGFAISIRASFNVSSITDNGTGNYTVNFTNAMTDANYSAVASAGDASTDARIAVTTTLATGSYRITTRLVDNSLYDTLTVQSSVFR